MSAAPGEAGPIARRPRNRIRRPHKVGPLALSTAEFADVRQAAGRAGLAPGAYAAQVVVAVARQEITALPSDVRTLLLDLVQARAELGELGALLRGAGEPPRLYIGSPADNDVVAARLGRTMRRLEEAADALAGRRGFT